MQSTVESFLKETMKTIPDAIDDIKYFWKKTKDVYFRFFEHYGSKRS